MYEFVRGPIVWDPVFSPDGTTAAAVVELDGRFALAVDGHLGKERFERLWSPAFSPDGKRVLLRGIEGGSYVRQVAPIEKLRS